MTIRNIRYFPSFQEVTVLKNKMVGDKNYPDVGGTYKGFYAGFTLGWNNRIKGKVVDVEGKELEKYNLVVLPASVLDKESRKSLNSLFTNPWRDKFDVYGLTPGKYILAIDFYPFYTPNKEEHKKRIFYSDSNDRTKISVIDIKATPEIEDLVFKIPYTIRTVKGKLFWSDGTPIKESSNRDKDEYQTFTTPVLEGFDYILQPTVYVFIMENGKRKRIKLKAREEKIKVGKIDLSVKFIVEKPLNLIEDY